MMSDMTFLAPSPWVNDLHHMKDDLLSEYNLLSDLPFDALDQDISNFRQETQSLTSWASDWEPSSSYQNSEISGANSECSDSLSVDIDGDLEDALLQTIDSQDFLSSATVKSNEGLTNQTDSIDFAEMDSVWSDTETNEDFWDPLSSNENTINTTVEDRETTLAQLANHNVPWTSLSCREQVNLVDGLSTIVSTQLGLREQLEIIRMISPESNISPIDTQFVIDITYMNDDKLQLICRFLQTICNNNNYHGKEASRTAHHSNHTNHHSNHTNHHSNSTNHHNNNTNHHNNNTNHHSNSTNHHNNHTNHHSNHTNHYVNNSHCGTSCHNVSDGESKSSNTQNRKSRKRSHKQQMSQRRRMQPHQKRAKQQLKEERSGLFTQEQVVSVDTAETGELDDVDILT